jgi:predicted RNA binding protein YcfA (HicA-like mRNA interferase family)
MTSDDIDWEQELRRAASHSARSLVRLALRAGWAELPARRGKGSHTTFWKLGAGRPVTIGTDPKLGTKIAIIKQLRGG